MHLSICISLHVYREEREGEGERDSIQLSCCTLLFDQSILNSRKLKKRKKKKKKEKIVLSHFLYSKDVFIYDCFVLIFEALQYL